ncbi:hypothetical protein PT974_07732 [Cladobotryum mycophilum]|uniref:S-adenosylmethionine-dependent methyltransferase n=1 Tax=Cladobotryum mycophilum TaxID=491253 RepID=A0ABR0SI56_9HYPO
MGLRARHAVPLSISLPPLRNTSALTATKISTALRLLRDLFCPLQADLDLDFKTNAPQDAAVLDSGYVSADDDDETDDVETACLDSLERDFALRWLTGFVGHAHELSLDDDTCERFVNVACSILSHLTAGEEEEDDGDEDPGITRQFEFLLNDDESRKVKVELHDTPMQTGQDHTDVGLQTWGASIVLSRRICKAPEDFGIQEGSVNSATRIMEFGAGTGLLSLALSSLLPHVTELLPSVIATDYHPTVLKNLELNAASHADKQKGAAPIEVCHLDWSTPSRDAPLDVPADIIIAADVAYVPEHATWLRDCAAHLLAPNGTFWLMVSIRPNGKFVGISDLVEATFAEVSGLQDGRLLKIQSAEFIPKQSGVGRADEVGYNLYRIMWA